MHLRLGALPAWLSEEEDTLKLLTNTTVQALLLILVLAFYAWLLGHDVITLKREQEYQARTAHINLSIAYIQPSGIDIYGKQVVASSLGAKRNIVFLLRNESLQNDLNYWSHVKTLLDSNKEIGLVGYCDSQLCAESMRKGPSLAFPVLAFGEAASIQAVANADANGEAILKKVGTPSQSKISWRGAENYPQRVAQEAIR